MQAKISQIIEEKDEKVKTIDIQHEIWSWGRAYHGQLGIKDL
jgi:hypothetical protein